MVDRGIVPTPEAFERIARVVRSVEGGGLGNVRSAPSRVQPAALKLIYPTTDLQPGSFAATTAGVYVSTAVGSTITLFRGGASSASSLTVYPFFQHGLNKRAKAIAFRPLPSKHWYAYQPPHAQWGKISSYSSAASSTVCHLAQVNPSTDCRGAGVDTGTTFTVLLPVRSGVDLGLSVGDVIGFVPSHWGQYVAVSDYSAAGGSAAIRASKFRVGFDSGGDHFASLTTALTLTYDTGTTNVGLGDTATSGTQIYCSVDNAQFDVSYTLSIEAFDSTQPAAGFSAAYAYFKITSTKQNDTERKASFYFPASVAENNWQTVACRTVVSMDSGDYLELFIETVGTTYISWGIDQGEVTFTRLV